MTYNQEIYQKYKDTYKAYYVRNRIKLINYSKAYYHLNRRKVPKSVKKNYTICENDKHIIEKQHKMGNGFKKVLKKTIITFN